MQSYEIFRKNQENLNNLLLRLQSVSVEAVLKRGFAWVKDENGHTIYNTASAQSAKDLEICFYDGSFKTASIPTTKPKNSKTPNTGKQNALQTDLFNF